LGGGKNRPIQFDGVNYGNRERGKITHGTLTFEKERKKKDLIKQKTERKPVGTENGAKPKRGN